MNTAETKSELHQALEDLEALLETPIVPGELPEWCKSAKKGCAAVHAALTPKLKDHEIIYKQIGREDPTLQPRVETMQAEDERLAAEAEYLDDQFVRAAAAADIVEPNEQPAEALAQELADRAIQYVIAIRKQEHAVRTWYIEALERDRGDKD